MTEIQSDPAAEFAVAISVYKGLTDRVVAGEDLDLSEPFQGGDEFMRTCVHLGKQFEAWACHNVDFEQLVDVWPYLLEEKFLWAWEQAKGRITTGTAHELADTSHATFFRILSALLSTQK